MALSVPLLFSPSRSLLRSSLLALFSSALPRTMPPESTSVPSDADISFMRLALVEATAALERQEVPIGCVLVDESGRVVAKGSNRTNEKRDATRHAELEAFDALRATDTGREEGDPAVVVGGGGGASRGNASDGDQGGAAQRPPHSNGAASSPAQPRSSLETLTLYVTCEPCVMCAAALSILKPRRVVFGCHNPRFGGVGSVLDVVAGRFPGCGLRHAAAAEGGKEKEEEEEGGEKEGERKAGGGSGAAALDFDGTVEEGEENDLEEASQSIKTLGGVLAAEAVALLKEFYETGNPSAPRPNRPVAAAATRAARKAAAEAAAGAAALAAETAAADAVAASADKADKCDAR